eukprot:2888943-Prymnesium_polylepis.1
MTVEEVNAAATAEGLALHTAVGSQTGYRCVAYDETAGCRPFKVRVCKKRLGSFATAEEAALCYARHVQTNDVALPKSPSAKRRVVVYSPGQNSMSAADALACARAEGLELQTAPNTATGFAGIRHDPRGYARPYSCEVGSFKTAEEAALAIARKRASSSRSDDVDSVPPNVTLAAAPPTAGCLEPEVPKEQDAVIHVYVPDEAVQVYGTDGEDGTVATEPGACSCCTAMKHRIR